MPCDRAYIILTLLHLLRLRTIKPNLHDKITQLMKIPPVRVASYSQRSLGDRDDIIQSQKPERLIDLWLLGAFVGALEPSQCYYVWDQCFIQGDVTLQTSRTNA